MSNLHALQASHLNLLNDRQPLPVLAQWAVAFAVMVTKWDTRHRTRKQLKQLNDAQLRDIGIERGAAYTEAARPFWRV